MGSVPAGELAHPLDGLVAALPDDVGRAEVPREFDPVGVAAKDDDLLGAQAFRGDYAAQTDRTVGLDGVPDGYRAMAERESIKVIVEP